MRLRPGLDHNLTVLRHAHLCQRIFQLEVNEEGEVERSGKVARAAAKAGKVDKEPVFKLPTGVVPLSNNSRQSDIIAMMPLFNAHGLEPSWVEPDELRVQEFFDTLHEAYIAAEPRLIQDTSQEGLDYIRARLRGARLAEESTRLAVEAGSAGGTMDSVAAEAKEEEGSAHPRATATQWIRMRRCRWRGSLSANFVL